MIKKYLPAAIASAVIALTTSHTMAADSVLPGVQTDSRWFTDGVSTLNSKPALKAGQAKNIILFIGDGMGISTMTAGRIRDGQLNGTSGEENYLSWEQWPSTALVKTYNTDSQVPDSAGTITAMVTGVKTRIGMLSVGPESERGDCATSLDHPLVTALTLAERKGLSTGVVSTARLTHATPAATYANSPDRNWEASADEGCVDIASQLVNYSEGNGIEVALGGGLRNFIPQSDARGSKRSDDRNLIDEWLASATDSDTRVFAGNASDLNSVTPGSTNKLLGLFGSSHMAYEHDRPDTDQPSLTEMTTKAIELLETNDNGYFLTVESGRIDHAHHDSNPYRALGETIEFSKAIQVTLDSVNLDETLIIVTADHGHVLTLSGYQAKGTSILGFAGNDKEGKPYTTMGYINGAGFHDGSAYDSDERVAGRQDLTGLDLDQLPDFRSETLVHTNSESHSGEDITVHAIGPGSDLFNGVIEQNVLFSVMNAAAELGAADYQ